MVMTASAAIIKGKKVLLVKRSNYTEAYPNHWAFPAGRADPGETPEQCVVREVKEEVGLDFIPKELFQTGQWRDRELNRFLGDWSGEVSIQEEEVDDFGWFTYEETKELPIAFDYTEVIEILHGKGLL